MTNTTENPTAPAATATAPGVIPLPQSAARALIAVGAAGTVASAFMSWTWTSEFPGDLTVYGYPAGLQILALIAGALTLLMALGTWGVRGLRWLNPTAGPAPVFLAAISAFTVTWFTAIAITVDLGGLVNLDPGAYVAIVASALAVAGALGLPRPGGELRSIFGKPDDLPGARELPGWAQRLTITACTAIALVIFTYGIGINDEDSETFVGFILLILFGAMALYTAGLLDRFSALNARHRGFATGMAFLAAALFPFTQSNDHNANLGVSILVFGTVALGLNIVVGLTGLLDLGYVAFLGVGAYAAPWSPAPSSPASPASSSPSGPPPSPAWPRRWSSAS